MPNLYIIAGCNGAGKTTASLTILPEICKCRSHSIWFVTIKCAVGGYAGWQGDVRQNKGVAGDEKDFAFETTLATRSYINLIGKAKTKGYDVTLLYFWLHSPEQAKERVAERVAKGGHNIEDEVVERRYYRGIRNFFKLYSPVCDNWMLIDNTGSDPVLIAKGHRTEAEVEEPGLWDQIQTQL